MIIPENNLSMKQNIISPLNIIKMIIPIDSSID